MTWVVVDDPVPGGATILGSGLGGQSQLLTRGEQREGWAWPAFEERRFEPSAPTTASCRRDAGSSSTRCGSTTRARSSCPRRASKRCTRRRCSARSPNAADHGGGGAVKRCQRVASGCVARAHRARCCVAAVAHRGWLLRGRRRRRRTSRRDARSGRLPKRTCSTATARCIDQRAHRSSTCAASSGRPLDAVSPALVAAIVDGEDGASGSTTASTGGACSARCAIGRVAAAARREHASRCRSRRCCRSERARRPRTGALATQARADARGARARARWTKAQILEAYLNLLGFRGELQGIGAASRMLAGKAPSGLALPESLVLAALLPSPARAVGRVAARACARAAAQAVTVSCDEFSAAAASMLDARSLDAAAAGAQLAPQLAHALLQRRRASACSTTLDAGVQRLAHERAAPASRGPRSAQRSRRRGARRRQRHAATCSPTSARPAPTFTRARRWTACARAARRARR